MFLHSPIDLVLWLWHRLRRYFLLCVLCWQLCIVHRWDLAAHLIALLKIFCSYLLAFAVLHKLPLWLTAFKVNLNFNNLRHLLLMCKDKLPAISSQHLVTYRIKQVLPTNRWNGIRQGTAVRVWRYMLRTVLNWGALDTKGMVWAGYWRRQAGNV